MQAAVGQSRRWSTCTSRRREALGGYLPDRNVVDRATPLEIPELDRPSMRFLKGTGDREMSTTMAAVRILQVLTRDKKIGKHVVPIVPDESRTFGMEGMFRRLGIYSSVGQLYDPVDSDQVAYYREEKDGQILQEGINEAGAMSSFIAAGTAYANHRHQHDPLLYFLFDVWISSASAIWPGLPGDMQCRGVPARGNGRSNDPGGRGPCNIRMATAISSRTPYPELRLLRSDLRL